MLHVREDGDFPLDHFAGGGLGVSADAIGHGRPLLHLHGELPRSHREAPFERHLRGTAGEREVEILRAIPGGRVPLAARDVLHDAVLDLDLRAEHDSRPGRAGAGAAARRLARGRLLGTAEACDVEAAVRGLDQGDDRLLQRHATELDAALEQRPELEPDGPPLEPHERLLAERRILADLEPAQLHGGQRQRRDPHRGEGHGAAEGLRCVRRDQRLHARQIDEVWEAIALHTSGGIAERRGPIARLTRAGVLADLGRHPLISADRAAAVHDQFPRLDAVRSIVDAAVAHAERSPSAGAPYSLAGELARERLESGLTRIEAGSAHAPWCD